jgi:hypothetical protein
MSTVTDSLSCPVCDRGGFPKKPEPQICSQCGWEVELLVAPPNEDYLTKLSKAREAWTNREPDLTRDPFEFPDEWQERLEKPAWKAGIVKLENTSYDVVSREYTLQPCWLEWLEKLASKPSEKQVLMVTRYYYL